MKKWEVLSSEPRENYRIFKVQALQKKSPLNGAIGEFYKLDMPNWVNVIALTPQDEIILVNQFRHGSEEMSLELPAGVVDLGEEIIITAQRELAEETGYSGDEPISLGFFYPNPAFQNNICTSYLIKNVQLNSEQKLDRFEDIEVIKVPLKNVRELIRNGKINHALTLAALYLLGNQI